MSLIVTTSWDDGHKLDLKLARLLDKYNIKGTFYIPKKYIADPLSEADIIELAKRHEIGAHTLTHPDLDRISLDEVEKEIKESKVYLENLLGKEINMFCYPRGKFNQTVKESVKAAGFIGARSTREFCLNLPKDNYEFGVSVHVYPFPFRKKNSKLYLRNRYLFEPLFNSMREMSKLDLPINSYFSWFNLAKNILEIANKKGQIFHLYGHSWEIDKYDMWHDLELLLNEITNIEHYAFQTNSEVLLN